MKIRKEALLAVFVASALLGCGSDSGKGSAEVQAVTVVDKGAVEPDPVTTTVAITPDQISYSQARSGGSVSSWSRGIMPSEYASVSDIVNGNQWPSSQSLVHSTSCTGTQGMTITVTSNNQTRSYEIPGDIVCDRTLWMTGARDLVNFEETLVAKYRPIN